jgi:hypothetical protein
MASDARSADVVSMMKMAQPIRRMEGVSSLSQRGRIAGPDNIEGSGEETVTLGKPSVEVSTTTVMG